MNYYYYDDVPEIRTIKAEEYEKRNMAIVAVNLLNNYGNKEIFGLDKFTESHNKHLSLGSIVKVKDMPYYNKWGIIVGVKVNEYLKILPSHKLSKNKTETATVYEIAMPCGFNVEAYGTETYGPSKEGKIIPMDVPFTVDTIPAYMESIEEKEREDFEEEMNSQVTISKREWLNLIHRVESLEEEIKYCKKYPNYEEY